MHGCDSTRILRSGGASPAIAFATTASATRKDATSGGPGFHCSPFPVAHPPLPGLRWSVRAREG